MFGLKIGNEFLDLYPGTELELEQENPFLQFDDKIVGEYSLPLTVPATPKNIRLLQYTAYLQQRSSPAGIDVLAYANGVQHSAGKVKIEKANVNLNAADRGSISIFYLTGISRFYQDLKGKALKEINAGGVRTFGWDNYNLNGNGFWAHIHKVIDAPAGWGQSGYDYAFFPVANRVAWNLQELEREYGTDVINHCRLTNGRVQFTKRGSFEADANVIVPYVYLAYVLRRIEVFTGWKLEGDFWTDPDFVKITIDNNRAIDWTLFTPVFSIAPFAGGDAFRPRNPVSFNLVDHLPEVSITEFLLAIRNRMGWHFDVDKRLNVVRIRKLQDLANTTIRDVSARTTPVVPKSIRDKKKIYGLKTTEELGAIKFGGVQYMGAATAANPIPAPAAAYYLKVYLVVEENNFFICRQEEQTQNYRWELFDFNIRDVEPAGATEWISTAALTTGNVTVVSWLDLIPQLKQQIFIPGRTDEEVSSAIMLLFYHGITNGRGGQRYPFASHHIYDPQGNQVGNWSLAWQGKKKDGSDVGIYELRYKRFLDTLSSSEEAEITVALPLVDYMNFSFSDVISVNGVRWYVMKEKSKLPYKGRVVLECSRLAS